MELELPGEETKKRCEAKALEKSGGSEDEVAEKFESPSSVVVVVAAEEAERNTS